MLRSSLSLTFFVIFLVGKRTPFWRYVPKRVIQNTTLSTLSSEAAAQKAEAVARSRIHLSETKTPVSQLTYPSGFAEPVNYVPHF